MATEPFELILCLGEGHFERSRHETRASARAALEVKSNRFLKPQWWRIIRHLPDGTVAHTVHGGANFDIKGTRAKKARG
jgi:hypothetical protein